MRRMLLLMTLLSVILPACAAANPAPAAIAPQGPAPTQPAVVPTASPVIKTEFTPTDPATVNLAAGKPQFVEFFAFW